MPGIPEEQLTDLWANDLTTRSIDTTTPEIQSYVDYIINQFGRATTAHLLYKKRLHDPFTTQSLYDPSVITTEFCEDRLFDEEVLNNSRFKTSMVTIKRLINNMEGFCYLWICLAVFMMLKTQDAISHEYIIVSLSRLGAWPTSDEILGMIKEILDYLILQDRVEVDSLDDALDSLISNPIRFRFSVVGRERIHCEGPVKMCEHWYLYSDCMCGATVKFMLFYFNNTRFGGTVLDANDVMGYLYEESMVSDSTFKPKTNTHISSLNNQAFVEDDLSTMAGDRIRIMKSREQPATIKPDDSISMVGKRNLIIEDEVEDIIRKLDQMDTREEKTEKDIMVNFAVTRSQALQSSEINCSLRPISGLQKLFLDDRLNFLMHLHTALYNSVDYPPFEVIRQLTRFLIKRRRNAQDHLLNLVLSSTMDFDEMRVLSNPFKLPILEVGMRLSEKVVVMCFTILEEEYQRKWFESMKGLKVPRFHDRFSNLSDNFLSGGSSSSLRQQTHPPVTNPRSHEHRKRASSRVSKARSVLGI